MNKSSKFYPRHPLQTPILFLVYNRPDVTSRVFQSIRTARPDKLFVAADGPKNDNKAEVENCHLSRKIATQIDWKCEVKTLFRNKNIGCQFAVGGAIEWFFDHVKEGIILEDDCLPSQSFFWFCQELLERYRNDKRVMLITGFNPVAGISQDASYLFSVYGGIWGWASWKRAWNYFDTNMHLWPIAKRNNLLKHIFEDRRQTAWRTRIFEEQYNRRINSWAYPWSFSRLSQSGLSIVSTVNLIQNIGFGINATHTKKLNNQQFHKKLSEIRFPLSHPKFMVPNREYDLKLFKLHAPALPVRIINQILRHLKLKKWTTSII